MRTGSRSVVALANEQAAIVDVCRAIGMEVPVDIPYGKSVKVRCPFGAVYHVDGGIEPAFRIYPHSNSAYCFASCGYFSPVWLYAQANDLNHEAAALQLLDSVGYKPLDYAHMWENAVQREPELDRDSLSEALKVFCSTVSPNWSETQFDPLVAQQLGRCLSLLPRAQTAEEAELWLGTCKQVMRRTLIGVNNGTG